MPFAPSSVLVTSSFVLAMIFLLTNIHPPQGQVGGPRCRPKGLRRLRGVCGRSLHVLRGLVVVAALGRVVQVPGRQKGSEVPRP